MPRPHRGFPAGAPSEVVASAHCFVRPVASHERLKRWWLSYILAYGWLFVALAVIVLGVWLLDLSRKTAEQRFADYAIGAATGLVFVAIWLFLRANWLIQPYYARRMLRRPGSLISREDDHLAVGLESVALDSTTAIDTGLLGIKDGRVLLELLQHRVSIPVNEIDWSISTYNQSSCRGQQYYNVLLVMSADLSGWRWTVAVLGTPPTIGLWRKYRSLTREAGPIYAWVAARLDRRPNCRIDVADQRAVRLARAHGIPITVVDEAPPA